MKFKLKADAIFEGGEDIDEATDKLAKHFVEMVKMDIDHEEAFFLEGEIEVEKYKLK